MRQSLAEENQALKAQVEQLKEQVTRLTAIIKLQQNQMFGKKLK